MEDLLGKSFLKKGATVDKLETGEPLFSQAKVVCVYFSAKWCPPCRIFSPILIEFYNDVNAEIEQLEIIAVSKDKSDKDFGEHTKDMPWLIVPYNDPRVEKLVNNFDVKGIPTLIVLGENGEAVVKTARQDVITEGPECFVKWLAQVQK